MKSINVTTVKQVNYTYHLSQSPQCRLLLYVGDGNSGEKTFRRGLAALIYPGQSLVITPESTLGNVYIISLRTDVLPTSVSAAQADGPVLLADPPDSLVNFFTSGWMLLEAYPDENAAYHTVSALLNWMVMHAPVPRRESAGSSPKILVEQAKTIIHNEYASDLTLQSVAAQLFVNPCYLSTVFHQVAGVTFRAYLKNVRLQHTCRLLTQTNHLITDIAMQTGFNSTAYLISTFRKEYGITPNAYRAKHTSR